MNRRSSGGSITPVWLVLLMTTLLLLVLFVDREWVNYQVRKVQQTADFAAEVGSAAAVVTYNLHIDGRTGEWVQVRDPEPCDPCGSHPEIRWSTWSHDCSGTLLELSGRGWINRCGCFVGEVQGRTTPWHECLKVKETKQEISWPSNTQELVMQTFNANWINRRDGRVTTLNVRLDGRLEARSTELTVTLLVSSPFGGHLWSAKPILRQGKATISIPPLKITQPT